MKILSTVAVILSVPKRTELLNQLKALKDSYLLSILEEGNLVLDDNQAACLLLFKDVAWYTGIQGYEDVDIVDDFMRNPDNECEYLRIGEEWEDIEYDNNSEFGGLLSLHREIKWCSGFKFTKAL